VTSVRIHLAGGTPFEWVGDGTKGIIHKVDPASNLVVESLRIGQSVRDVTVGEGAVWVSAGDRIVRIESASGNTSDLEGSVVGPGGSEVTIRDRFTISAGGGFVWETFSEVPEAGRHGLATSDFRRFDVGLPPRDVALTGTDVWFAG
jgi:hypothetical protein